MSAAVHLSTGTKPQKGIQARDHGGTLRTIKSGSIRTVAGLKAFFSTFAATLTADHAYGFVYNKSGAGGRATTFAVTVNVAGGNAPFAYAWSYVSGDVSVTPTAPTAATTKFDAALSAGDEANAVWNCTVSDASGATLTTGNVTIHLENASIP